MNTESQSEKTHLSSPRHQLTHLLFVVGIAVKGIIGVLETLASFVFFGAGAITDILITLTRNELGEDPGDFFANKLSEALPYFSLHTQLFVAWYFLIHGVIKIILVGSLIQKKLWAYPAYMTALCLFALYQVYRFTHTHSFTLIILTVFDIVMVSLVWREYQFVRRKGISDGL